MDFDLFRMRVFVEVIDTGGYTSAAQKLGLSQSTVSSHVAKLEHQLGIKLIIYDGRDLRLSSLGLQVYKSAKTMLREQDSLVELVRSRKDERVRFGASMAFEQPYFFSSILKPFVSRSSNTLLSIWFGHSVELAERVRTGDLDVALVLSWVVPAGLRVDKEGTAQFKFFVSRSHPLVGKVVSPRMISSAGLISAPLDSIEWKYYSKVLTDFGLSPSDVILEINGIQSRMIAASMGLGVVGVFCPDYARPDLESGLCELSLDRQCPQTDIVLLRSKQGPRSEAVNELARLITRVSIS